MSAEFQFRLGAASDAAMVAALATQVFLDTYATHGVRADLAREAFQEYSEQAFVSRFAESDRKFALVLEGNALLGFAEVLCSHRTSAPGLVSGGELVRLYVQPRAQRAGLGRGLVAKAEHLAGESSLSCLWLTVWNENVGALAFYRRMGYADAGSATYSFGGNAYDNQVLAKELLAA